MLDTTNKILATTGALLVVLQTLAFGYWIHVDSKLTARLDASNARATAMDARLDATWKELMDLRKDIK